MRPLAGQRAGPVRTASPSKSNRTLPLRHDIIFGISYDDIYSSNSLVQKDSRGYFSHQLSRHLPLALVEGLSHPRRNTSFDTFHARQHQQWAPILPCRRRNHGGSSLSLVKFITLCILQFNRSTALNCCVTRLGQGLSCFVVDFPDAPLIPAKACAYPNLSLRILP